MTVFFTREGYFKKITPQSLRMSGEQKLKDGDAIVLQQETKNNAELLFFTNRCQVYKCRAGDFADGKASLMGEYIPARLGMDEGEMPVCMAVTEDYKGHMFFVFENGKAAKVPMSSYATKQNRRKLLNAFSDKAPLFWASYLHEAVSYTHLSQDPAAVHGRALFHFGVPPVPKQSAPACGSPVNGCCPA